jgi:hypothetical protein
MAGDGERWYDHGEGQGGDVLDFYARALCLSIPEAVREMATLLPDNHSSSGAT